MIFSKKLKRNKFSLIELLIVVGIMGALAALILPAFSDSESAAKDTACDYNQAGTIRYLTMFHSANGVYPSGMHTGANNATATSVMSLSGTDLSSAGTTADGVFSPDSDSALTTAATYNLGSASTATAITGNLITSLQNAGIVSLAYGTGVAKSLSDGAISVFKINSTGNVWTEAIDPITGGVVVNTGSGEPLTVRGVTLEAIAKAGEAGYTYDEDEDVAQFRKPGESDFIVVPLYIAPTMDWETYYSGGPNSSKISIAMAGKCPWGEGGTNRYYIAFFKVYEDGTAAKLLATSCPDCGILDSDTF